MSVQDDLITLGYRFQCIALARIYINIFQFALDYAPGEVMKHCVDQVQEREFAARDKGYTFGSDQQKVGSGYFDDVTTVIQGGTSRVTALTGSTEEQFYETRAA